MWLIDLDDAELQSSLGLTLEDIVVLRGGAAAKSCSPSRSEITFREADVPPDYLYDRQGNTPCPRPLAS
jgi:hypothetical protein